jgi:hypothetical protein
VIADFLSHYPRTCTTLPTPEIHLLEDSSDDSFPQDFSVLSAAQQKDPNALC